MFSPPGYLIGTVEQNWSLCIDEFDVKNESGTTVLKLEGPLCTTSCCGSDVEFKVKYIRICLFFFFFSI